MINLQIISRLTITLLISSLSLACSQVERSTVASTANDQARIRQLIADLSRDDQSEQAESELLAIAKLSTANRDRVVQDLIADVKTHEELNQQQAVLSESFYFWFRATRIFSVLQAAEAIDVMIQCIHCGNEMTGSLNVRPAFDALQSMGGLAVPKLSEALRQHPKSIVRAQAALCLGNIGGSTANEALGDALRSETDPNVIQQIKVGISTIANHPKG